MGVDIDGRVEDLLKQLVDARDPSEVLTIQAKITYLQELKTSV